MTIVLAILLSMAAAGAGADPKLAIAVKTGDKAAVENLLQQRVDVNAPETDGTTALHWAVNRDDLETIDLLLAAGANPRLANRYGVTPLNLAATNGAAVHATATQASAASGALRI